jgi:hypothetical protein
LRIYRDLAIAVKARLLSEPARINVKQNSRRNSMQETFLGAVTEVTGSMPLVCNEKDQSPAFSNFLGSHYF